MRILIIILATVLFSNTYAQNLKVDFGELLPSPRYTVINDAGVIGDKLFVFERQRNMLLLKIFNPSTMKFLTSKIIQQNNCKGIKDCISDDFGYEKTLFMKGEVIMLFSTYDKSSKQSQMFAQKINKEGNFEGKMTMIDRIPSESRRNSGSFITWFCEDSTKFLVIQNPPFDKYAGEKFSFKIYNSKLENTSNFSASLPYKDKNVSVDDYYLSNDGTVYMLVNVTKEKDQKEKGQDLSFYSILTLKGDGTMSEYQVKLPEKDIETIALKLDEVNKKVICTGLYSDISKGYSGKKVDGIFFLKVDVVKKEIETSGYKSISNAILASILDVKEEKIDKNARAASGSKNFKVNEVISNKDGSTTIITEYRQLVIRTSTTTSSNGSTTTTTTYHYYRKNIFVINVAKDGSITSFVDIPKYQHSVNDGGFYLSYLLIKKDDRLIFIYNDNPENMTNGAKSIQDFKQMSNIKKANVVAVELKKDGTFSKQEVYNVATKKIIMAPEIGICIGNGKYIVPINKAPGSCGCFAMFSKFQSGLAKFEL